MRRLIAVGFALLLLVASANSASANDTSKRYVTGKLLDLTVQPVDRGTAIIGNMAAPIRSISYVFQIRVDDLVYFAQYTVGARADRPNWVVNDPIDLRFEKDKMFLRRPDGKEVEVWLAKTVRVSPGEQASLPSSSVGLSKSDSSNDQPLELAQALQEVRARLPKWRAILSSVDVESLPIQYKEGKQVEFLKSQAVEGLDRIDKTARSLEKEVAAQNSAQLLLDMQDAAARASVLGSAFLWAATLEKGGATASASDSAKAVLDMSTDMMMEEKKNEVPVMRLLAARDALLEVCKAKLAQ
ncbi:MAG: hypothetical protein LAP86_34905 [Acidobacteriia bacterium]|nr:hypothetical protein [Terriglobia bacterium]